MDFFLLAIVILIALAIADLVVGVSNDAVNFVSSSVGSRVASNRTIMILASAGILAGVTFSSGMMEVARKGIFHPNHFTMPELLAIFLAVMLTDVILLDLFSTFGLPTSTTVSVVFELLGAAVAVSVLKLRAAGASLAGTVDYINTGRALAIVFGILVSVAVAFVAGALVQFLSRLLFTFDYERRLRRWGALWSGAAMAAIAFFILFKGARGASFLDDRAIAWIHAHTGTLMLATFAAFAAGFQLLVLLARVNVLKLVVLAGTFALAMAFAANDLVNFVGVPLAGLASYAIASASGDLLGQTMEALAHPVRANTLHLLAAGGIMVATLWLSRKARTVTETTIRLARQDEGFERFEATAVSRAIVRSVASLLDGAGRAVPAPARRWVRQRLDRTSFRPRPGVDGAVPSFDLVRAGVNLTVAAALIAFATSLKLPLSTTYVTFMVAMGTSLSDQAWGRDSAVYRVSGVLTVVGGWFFTALMAFTVAGTFATAIFFGGTAATVALLALAATIVVRTHVVHRERERHTEALDVFNLRKVTDWRAAMAVTFEHTGVFLDRVREVLATAFQGLFTADRGQLRKARSTQRTVQQWSNIIGANIFKVLRLLQWEEDAAPTQRYAETITSLQEISESVRDIAVRAELHVANNHSSLLEAQVAEIERVHRCLDEMLRHSADAMRDGKRPDLRHIAARNRELRLLIDEFHQNQIMRIQDNTSKTRLSILFYSLTWDCLKLAEQSTGLLTVFGDALAAEPVPAGGESSAPGPLAG